MTLKLGDDAIATGVVGLVDNEDNEQEVGD
jgi:hypothetical protein